MVRGCHALVYDRIQLQCAPVGTISIRVYSNDIISYGRGGEGIIPETSTILSF